MISNSQSHISSILSLVTQQLASPNFAVLCTSRMGIGIAGGLQIPLLMLIKVGLQNPTPSDGWVTKSHPC